MKFISLFSGIGGFDLGFENAGMECVAQVENNAAARTILERHYPHVERFEDVRYVGKHNLPAADLVCGGFPCQDVSVAGNRAGLAGSRSGLWFQFLRILTELTPRWVVIENVPGLLSSQGGRDFAVILHGLVECGYRVTWRVLDAQHFGVAQRRRRVFIIGSLGDGRSAEVLFERTGGAGHLEPGSTARQRPAATASGGAASRSYNEQRSDEYADASVASTLASRDGKGVRTVVAGTLSSSGARTARTGNARNESDMLVAQPIVIKTDNTNSNGWGVLQDGTTHTLGGSTDVIAFTQNEREEVRDLGGRAGALSAEPGTHQQNYIAFTNRGRESQGLAETLRAGSHGALPMPSVTHGVRRLTPTECSRLQGFPDDWLEGYDADAEEAHATEVLHGMWRDAGTETRSGRRSGVALALLTPDILLAGVYGGWLSWQMAAECATARREIPGADAWSENFVRLLWEYAEYRPAPYRRESFEQLAGELGRSVQELPLEGAQARAFVRGSWVWAQASAEWALRPPFTTAEARRATHLSDSARYQRLGNAVAVPVAQWIGQRIAGLEDVS